MKAKALVKLLLILFLIGSSRVPKPETTEEYDIKAAFVYKFTNYIDWGVHLSGDEFIIGVMGQSPIKSSLAEIARTKTIKNKKISIHQFYNPEEIRHCQILFISQKITYPLYEILLNVPDKGTLLITEQAGYASQGAGINFVMADNKLKFEANPGAINAEGLTASSQLLKLAVIVN